MNSSSKRGLHRLALFCFVFGLGSLPVLAQVVSSGMFGLIRDNSGAPIAGATVVATHQPTGTVYSAVTRADGRYQFGSMVVGGPYVVTVDASGMKPTQRGGVTTALGADIEVSISLEREAAGVVTMERFTVEAASNELDGGAMGAGAVLGADRLASKPSTQRSLADLISASPLVNMRASAIGDREESQLNAVGQNARYNSISIDGAKINDQFGLNMTGLASFFNPLSVDTLEQLSVQVSPYDIRQAGFTGAAVNAVTKSGTNRFGGSAYFIWGGDSLLGLQMQGEDIATLKGTGRKVVPKLERTTQGFTFGGPILRNRLFFFLNYEEFERISAPAAPGLLDDNPDDMAAFVSRLSEYNTAAGQSIDWGRPITGTTFANRAFDEKKLAKIDWNITRDHRLSVRYSTTEGGIPQLGKYQSTNVPNSISNTPPGNQPNSSGATALDTHIYTQERIEEVWAGQLFSQWTPNFRTELKYSQTSQEQDTPLAVVAPEIVVYGVRGIDRNGNAITNAAYVAGTEFSRHGNAIYVDSKSYSLSGDYNFRSFTLTAGYDREESDFLNLFRQGSFGTVVFRNLADFLADRPADIRRNAYDVAARGTAADISDYSNNALFAQARWDVSPRLTLQAGVRYEFVESDKTPPFNQSFLNVTGFNNTYTLDGASQISPRVSFNYAANDDRSVQIRGGFGHFSGRTPWVFFSNSFNSPGVGDFQIINAAPAQGAFTEYLQNFDPENPIGTGTDNPSLRRAVNWVDDGIELPAVWRGNLAVDIRLPVLDSTLSFEYVHTLVDEAFFITNENLRPTGTFGADGRRRFSGNPSSSANALYSQYTDLYRLRNASEGESRYFTAMWDRPMKDRWSANVSYVRGRATEVQAFGQTTASGQWQRNAVFNQGEAEVGTADTEVKDRIQLSYTREFEFIKNWKTRATIYYEGRTGDPYSWVYSSDLNGDGSNATSTANDLVAVPSGLDDPRFDFSAMPAAQLAAYLDFFATSELAVYAGGIAPKNAFTLPWLNRLDLKFTQEVPLYAPSRFEMKPSLELFLDFINFGAFLSEDFFGYFLETPQKHFGSEQFRRMRVNGSVAYGANGLIRPTSFTGVDNLVYENSQSRWKIQVGARLRF
jgi:hypothetical protein